MPATLDMAMDAAWHLVSDRVMGGVSDGTLARETVARRPALRMRGAVRLENDGGFLQMARDLGPDGAGIDASGHDGIEFDVFGNDETYNIHLRTADIDHPWQSYRASFTAPPHWTTQRLPLSAFAAHRIEVPFDPATLRRIGFVAIGRVFHADLSLGALRFY